jgi:hypothetical protein
MPGWLFLVAFVVVYLVLTVVLQLSNADRLLHAAPSATNVPPKLSRTLRSSANSS